MHFSTGQQISSMKISFKKKQDLPRIDPKMMEYPKHLLKTILKHSTENKKKQYTMFAFMYKKNNNNCTYIVSSQCKSHGSLTGHQVHVLI